MLEAASHEDKSFVTLTYDEQHIPDGSTLNPSDLSRFLKRFRRSIYPNKIRYFGVGEYGDQTQRPHYHLALFGYPVCDKAGTSPNRNGYCCPICERVQRDWALGNIHSGGLEKSSAAYIAGYVTKKLTNKNDERLNGRHPEFARMSLRPGIGSGYTDEVSSTLLEYRLDSPEYLPTRLRHGIAQFPLGRYLRNQIRAKTGISKEELQAFLDESQNQDVQNLREIAYSTAPVGSKSFAFKQALIDAAMGRIIQLEAQYRQKKKDML